ncbi:MAG: FAD-dependent oxidoreductase [Acidobacteriota bacterium]
MARQGGVARVAVLGAGFQGTCIALELARRGVAVDLYDRENRPITRAGRWNEGKVHLGFVYANDPTRATAARMVDGALAFRRALSRWIDVDDEVSALDPFVYAVPRDSMLSVSAIRDHFEAVDRLIAEGIARGGDYLGDEPGRAFDEMPRRVWSSAFDPARIQTVFRTVERSVDPAVVARRLRAAVTADSTITWLPNRSVLGVSSGVGRREVASRRSDGDEVEVRTYPMVINALWEGRPEIDLAAGIRSPRPFFHRLKYGVWIDGVDEHRPASSDLPSTTLVLGPYGDIVRFRGGQLYLCWYPSGRVAAVAGTRPPHWAVAPSEERGRAILRESLDQLAAFCPAIGHIEPSAFIVRGGPIVALGQSDIESVDSRLHTRSEVEPKAVDGYISVPTGKYTLAPFYALDVADRVLA